MEKKIKLSDKQKEVIRLMRGNDKLRIQYEHGLNPCVVFGAKHNIGDYKISIPTAMKLYEFDLIESDGTEKRQAEKNFILSTLGKTINID